MSNSARPGKAQKSKTTLSSAEANGRVVIDVGLISDDSTERWLPSPDNEIPANTAAQTLLEALKNFVIPLVHAADGGNTENMSQVSLGPEAESFLTALQKFILSLILQSQPECPNENEPDQGDSASLCLDYFEDASQWLWHSPMTIARSKAQYTRPDPLNHLEDAGWLWTMQAERPTGLKMLQLALQERVFKTMPIRVLYFIPQPHGAELQITLLDRNGIYEHLLADLDANYSENWFQQEVAKKEARYLDMGVVHPRQAAELRIVDQWVAQRTGYVILSHTWLHGKGEVTYSNWYAGQFDSLEVGYQKLVNFCNTASRDYGFSFGWMDTICINKESSSELDESIRSMYKWYKNASICITYLANTTNLSDMHRDLWFTRGWTLQELLAPMSIKFYNRDWNKLASSSYSDNNDPLILDQIQEATSITHDEFFDVQAIGISRKMQLAAERKVTREEDSAYSMMGICDVSISVAYGEGAERAFFRLFTEILSSSPTVFDVFNCALNIDSDSRGRHVSSLLPFKPAQYLHRITAQVFTFQKPMKPFILTHLGLRIPVLLMPGLARTRLDSEERQYETIGDFYGTVNLVSHSIGRNASYELFHKECPSIDRLCIDTEIRAKILILGTLNFGGDKSNIHIPRTCLSVGLKREYPELRPILTYVDTKLDAKGPIVFEICLKGGPSLIASEYYIIKHSELKKHGMELQTLYL